MVEVIGVVSVAGDQPSLPASGRVELGDGVAGHDHSGRLRQHNREALLPQVVAGTCGGSK